MKVLWFASTSSGYKQATPSHHYHGAGWISSLEQLIAPYPGIELSVCFFHPTDNEKLKQGLVTYYPIRNKKISALHKLYNNWTVRVDSESETLKFLEVIEDFKPDIIQVFGTEGSFAGILSRTSVPVVIHVQGIINPYLNAWYPPGINGSDVFYKGSTFLDILKANGNWFARKQFIKRSEREKTYFPFAQFLMGRTEWDKNVSELLMPQAKYFEVNEVLRPLFYEGKLWSIKKRVTAKIFSNISSSIYKGLDQVLKTAAIIKNISKTDFQWMVSGISSSDPLIKLMERKFELKFAENNVKFLGTVSPGELMEKLLDSDVYVHPSYIENSPNSVGEAQILGIPVIGCYVGGLTSIIENNKTGILVPANDPYTMAVKIIYLSTNKNGAEQMGINAAAAAAKRHNKETILSSILNVYNVMLEK